MKRIFFTWLLLALGSGACSFGKNAGSDSAATRPGPDPFGSSKEPPIPTPGEGWITEQDSNQGLADLTISRMTASERERVRNEVSRNSVTWVNSQTGYSLYKIAGSERFERNAFILPKVLIIGGVDGGRASLHDLTNGEVALTIPIALIDGSQKELPYSTTRIRIPDSLFLDEGKRLLIRKELSDMFGYEHELSGLGACPQKISIKIAGVENDVTPRIFSGPNGPTGCQANQPFTVTLQGSRKYIERFLSDDVFNGSAEIAAMYEVAGSYVDEIRLYQIKSASFYSRLKAKLVTTTDKGEERKEVTPDEAGQLLIPMVQEALSKWAARERLIDRVKSQAVSQLKLLLFDEKSTDKGKFLVLKKDDAFTPLDVPARVVNESLGRQGEFFYSSSIIKPILNSTNIAIRGEGRQNLGIPPSKGIAQDVFTVREGDEYELQLTSLLIHEYEFPDEQSQPQIQDKGLVCLDKPGETLPACRKYLNECIEYKPFCKKPKTGCVRYGTKRDCGTTIRSSVTGCLSVGLFGDCRLDRDCSDVTDPGLCLEYGPVDCEEWGTYCSETHQICAPGYDEPLCKRQITDLRISRYYSAPAPVNNRVVNAPLGNSDQDVVSGLTLRFRWPDGKQIDCLILALLKDVTGQSIRFKVKNNEYCKPFPEGYKGEPVLTIVNKISSERQDIPCGIMNYSTVEGTKYYGCNGYNAVDLTPDQHVPGEPARPTSFSESPLYLTYYPVVDVNGVLISRSGAFQTEQTKEGQW